MLATYSSFLLYFLVVHGTNKQKKLRNEQKERKKSKNKDKTSTHPKPFFGLNGQQTNSTPEKTSIPQGNNMAKLLTLMPRSRQACVAVRFHWSKSQQRVWLWMWSNRQCSGTKRASLWKGPATWSENIVLLMWNKVNRNRF